MTLVDLGVDQAQAHIIINVQHGQQTDLESFSKSSAQTGRGRDEMLLASVTKRFLP
jgi:hypothetical protein